MNYKQIKRELLEEKDIFDINAANTKIVRPSSFTIKMRKANKLMEDIVIDVVPYDVELEKKDCYGITLYFANMASGDVIRNGIYSTNVVFDTNITEEEYAQILENADKLIGVNCEDINYGYIFNAKSKDFILSQFDSYDNLKIRLNNLNTLVRNFYSKKENAGGLTVEQYINNCTKSNLLLNFVSKQIPIITLTSGYRCVQFFKDSQDRTMVSKGEELSKQLENDFNIIKTYKASSAAAARKWAQVQGVVKEYKQKQEAKDMPQMDYDNAIIRNTFTLE